MARLALLVAQLIERVKTENLPQWVQTAFEKLYKESYREGYEDGQEDYRNGIR